MSKLKDFTGHVISVGDKLAYPVRSGSQMWMRAMIVNAFTTKPVQIFGINEKGSSVKLLTPGRCVIIEKEK